MNLAFIAILQQLAAEQGKEALLNPAKCKAFLADYTRGEYKKESRLLLQALEAGVQKAIDTTGELEICKKQQARILQEEHFLTEEAAADVVDTLALVLKGKQGKVVLQGAVCTHCGKELQKEWNVCPYCGTSAVKTQPEPLVVESPPNLELNSDQQKTADEFIARGKRYYDNDDFDNAIKNFDNAIVLNPNDAWVYASRALAYKQLGQRNQAIQDFEKAFSLNPKISGWIKKELLEMGSQLPTLPTSQLKTANEFVARGKRYYDNDDFDNAIKNFDNAIRLDPYDAWVYASRALAYKQLGQKNQAIQDFEKAFSLNPENFGWIKKELWEMGSPLSFSNQLKIAKEYIARGKRYYDNDDFDNAIRDFDNAIRLDPNDASAYYYRGEVYRLKGQYDAAIRDFSEATWLNPNYDLAYASMGQSYRQLGQRDQAIRNLEKAISLNPNNQWAKKELREIQGY
jgi:tetratricopeptide (TPR) repeat protein